jgi:tetrapyrrole methylase family protein/MazG family protein
MNTEELQPSRDIDTLIQILRYLRSPAGCPWDQAQTNQSLVRYTLEEAYEVADAVAQGQRYKICEELGDLLLHIVFHSQIAAEQGKFDFGDVVLSITEKLIRRHPHVFAGQKAANPEEVSLLWAEAKKLEPASFGGHTVPPLPGLLLLQKIAGDVDIDVAEDPLMRQLLAIAQQASREKRCLEAEIKGFYDKIIKLKKEFGN